METRAAAAAADAAAAAAASSGSITGQTQQQQQQHSSSSKQQQQQRQQRWRFDIAGDTPPILAETTLVRGGGWLRFPLTTQTRRPINIA